MRREDITRPSWPDYHGKMTPGAMEAGLADAGDADQNGSPRTPPKSVEHQLVLEYKKLKKAQRQKRQNEEKAPEAEPPDQACSYDDVLRDTPGPHGQSSSAVKWCSLSTARQGSSRRAAPFTLELARVGPAVYSWLSA